MQTRRQKMTLIALAILLALVLLFSYSILSRRPIENYPDPDGPVFTGSYAPEPGEFDGRLKVVTWNVHFGKEVDEAIDTLETIQELKDADVLLAADCTAYAYGDFHGQFLQGKRLAIACPKLDSNQDIYLDKLKALIDFAGIRSLTVLTMEVPCCRGLLQLARKAAAEAERKISVQWLEIGVQGDVLQEQAVG